MKKTFFSNFTDRPLAPAFEATEGAVTWADLDVRARAWAADLTARGVLPGDRVAVSGPAGLPLVTAIVAHLRAGVVHVPINGRYRAPEVRHILVDSGARLLVAAADSEAAATARALGLPVVPLDAAALTCAAPAAVAPPWPAPPPPPDATALIIYTSGTTGQSKGVALTHGALVANIGATVDLWRFTSADVLVLALPLFHVHGLGLGVLGALLTGLTVRLLPRFEPAQVVDAFARHGAMVFMGVPTMYRLLLEHLATHPEAAAALSRGRLFTAGSAALPAADLEAFAVLTGQRILERYGMTETGFVLSNPYAGERRAGTVGRPVPGYAVRVVDDDGVDVAPGTPGELLARGAGLMAGYWGQPEVTAAAYRDGWFKTGDVVTADPDGYYRVVGRRSVDIIKSGGFKIAAREIEEVLLGDPRLYEVAVLGVPDATWGERVLAAVVLAPGVAPLAPARLLAELQAAASTQLADYKLPRELRILDALPRNALGKVQKHLLRG